MENLDVVVKWRAAWEAMCQQAGADADTFAAFISDLVLHFGPPADDRLLRPEQAPEQADIEHLAATLQALVADPSRPVELSRTELLERLGWADRLRFRHPHAFPVPTIYTANDAARRRLREQLRTVTGGYIGLVGPAGSGKSTLLASLSWHDRRVVRYYAFVPDAPDPLSGRGEADSFLHDITLALEEAGLPRQGYGNDLRSQRAVLFGQLDKAGQRCRDHGESTVIIIDGLDHITREQHPSRSLLEELPPPAALPDGVFVVLGTQTTAILPVPIREALAADRRTVDLPPLSAAEVLHLADATGPGDWLLPGQRDRLVSVSEGHPLALTYLLQELSTLEVSEPDIAARTSAADQLLSDASKYGREVEARYRGYLLAAGSDPELVDLLAAVARLRAPVDVEWLTTWVGPRVLDAFVQRTATFFRRDGTVWRFIHNSFRRFLVEETARVGGAFNVARDRELHIALADACANSPPEWSFYRDEELAHRYLAGQYDRVLELATPALLRAKLFDLRPPAAVRDHALLALRAAAETNDHAAYVRMLLFVNELWQREYVIDASKLAEAMVKLGPPERALEHLVAGGQLRVPVETALKCAAQLARTGHSEASAQVLRAVGGLTDIVHQHRQTGGRDADTAVADWAEATFHLSGLDAVLAQLDDQLPSPVPRVAGSATTEPPAADDEAKRVAERRRREEEQRNATVISCRNHALARCFDLLTDIRDYPKLATLLDRIDAEGSGAWRARARVVRTIAAWHDGDRDAVLRWARDVIEIDSSGSPTDHDIDEEEAAPSGRTGVVPLDLRLQAAEFLIRAGFIDAPEIDKLVPPGTAAVWPSTPSGQDGLTPFLTTIDLWRIREIRPDDRHEASQPTTQQVPSRKAGEHRFRGALKLLAELEARQLAASIGQGAAPNVVGESDPIIRLLEVPERQTRDWTGWYFIRDAAPGLFRRLIHLGAAGGQDRVAQLLTRFGDAWTNADRAPYWSPSLKQGVLCAIHEVCNDEIAETVRAQLERLNDEITARAWGPHDRVETWLAQADVWRHAGDQQEAEKALRAALRASLGPGIHDDDRQLAGWLEWLRAAADSSVVERDEFISIARAYAGRLVGADDDGRDTSEAAVRLVELLWVTEPGVSTALAESLCDTGVLDEAHAINAALVGAARDHRVPVILVAVAASQLLIPLLKDPPDALQHEIECRQDAQTPVALTTIANAIAAWSVREDLVDNIRPSSEAQSPSDFNHHWDGQPPANVHSLLTAMRQASGDTKGQPDDGWASAVEAVADEQITPAIAKALLDEASRLRLPGEALGGIVAMAARAGVADLATEVLATELARAPAYGWFRHYDGGSRLRTFAAALRHREPALVQLAAKDLAVALSTGSISGQISPDDLRRITEVIGGTDAVARAWPDIAEYLDVFAPTDANLRDADHPVVPSPSAVETLLRWASGYFGHPVRALDFGARRLFHAALEHEPFGAQRVLADAIRAGGWSTEAALHTLVTLPQGRPVGSPGLGGQQLSPELAAAIRTATSADDAISRDLARRLVSRYQLSIAPPSSRRLPDTYQLALPPLRDRTAPVLDSQGVPHLDIHDPQHIVAPFDLPLRLLADKAGLEEETVLYRAASIATALDLPWIRGGHRAHADRLKTRGQLHTYRPWAYMAGRRALGIVLGELLDASALGSPPALPGYHLGLVDEVLIHMKPTPLDASNPPPWRHPEATYDVRGWCEETDEATRTYADVVSNSPTYVLAEDSEWCTLEWGKPEERRVIQTHHGDEAPTGLALPSRETWERTYTPASAYPGLSDLNWADEQLVVQGWELHTDAPCYHWLALHPAVADRLGWHPDDELFAWRGDDGTWRARTVRRVRGQLSHQPPARTYCAEVWQVIISDSGLADLRATFGPLRRHLLVERELPAQPREGRTEPERARAQVSLPEPA